MTTYTYTPIDYPGAFAGVTFVSGINDTGEIVGQYQIGQSADGSPRYTSFLYADGTYTTMPDILGDHPFATAINDLGQVVGTAAGHIFLYADGTYTILETNPLTTGGSAPLGVNDSGEIVGTYDDSNGPHGFLYSKGTYTTLDDPLVTNGTSVYGINDSGQIVGAYSDNGAAYHTFVYTPDPDSAPGIGTYTTLPDDPLANGGQIVGRGINNAGQIAGTYYDNLSSGVGGYHAFVYTNGTYTTLIDPADPSPDGGFASGSGINDSGQIVGHYYDEHGFLANPAGSPPNQLPTIDTANSTVTGTVNEQPNITGSTASDALSGVAVFSDADTGDRPTASVLTQNETVTYTAADGTDDTSQLTSDQIAIFENAFSIVPETGNTNTGKIDWTYSIADKNLDFLGVGDKVQILAPVHIDDGHGGTVIQNIIVTINGADEPPAPAPSKSAEENFTSFGGQLPFLAHLANAAYHLGLPLETALVGYNNKASTTSDADYNLLGQSLRWLTATDLPSLIPKVQVNTDPKYQTAFPETGISNGIYVNQNAAALVGVSSDALFISFRGTNDADNLGADLLKYFATDGSTLLTPDEHSDIDMPAYYALLRPLFDTLVDGTDGLGAGSYLQSHPNIKTVYLTGHSLGAGIVQEFMAAVNHTDEKYQTVTFGDSGYQVLNASTPSDSRVANIIDQYDPILQTQNVLIKSTLGNYGHVGDNYIINFPIASQDGVILKKNGRFVDSTDSAEVSKFKALDWHSLDLYRALADTISIAGYSLPIPKFADNNMQDTIHVFLDVDFNSATRAWQVTIPSESQTGTSGADLFYLAGQAASPTINGGAGDDTLAITIGGTVNIAGVSGVETYELTNATSGTIVLSDSNFANVNGGLITMVAGNAGDVVVAISVTAPNRVTFTGGTGKDAFTGGAGNDTFKFSITDLADTDTLRGGLGTDTLLMTNAGTVAANGVSGIERIMLASGAANTLTLTDANFTNVTGAAIHVFGGGNGNTVDGSALAATNKLVFTGGAGNDKIEAGANTVMNGGGGDDQFIFTEMGTNQITDFAASAGNKLVFSDIGFQLGADDGQGTSSLQYLDASIFVANAIGKFTSTDQRFAYNATTGTVFYDPDGSGSAFSKTAVVTLADHAALRAGPTGNIFFS